MKLQRQSNHESIDLEAATELGVGGEAKVYAIKEDTTLVAKVYHRVKDEYGPKLAAMVTNPPHNPTAKQNHLSFAWPEDLLLNRQQQVVGFLMPRVSGMRAIIDLYNPKTRRTQWPWFEYSRLHRSARNLAGALKSLHEGGYVIGDVNESNILVTETTLVTLVDMDSVQVRHSQTGEVYRCLVGKPEFTPPELQGQSFADFDRTPEQDNFGLAVLIFQLLMEGTHPFAGVYKLLGDPPSIAQRIAQGYFPHGKRIVPFTPMPAAPPFTLLHPKLQLLFHRCFEEGFDNPHVRPDAKTWQIALQEAESTLVICDKNEQHRYGNHLDRCPWCDRTHLLNGRDPFPSQKAVQQGQHLKPLNRKKIPIQPAFNNDQDYFFLTRGQSSASFSPSSALPVSWKDPRRPSLHPLLAGLFILTLTVGGLWYGSNNPLEKMPFSSPKKITLHTAKVKINLLKTLEPLGEPVSALLISPNGQTLVSNGKEGTVKLWELPTGTPTHTLRGHQDSRGTYSVSALAMSRDGKILASASRSDNGLKLWNFRTSTDQKGNQEQWELKPKEGLQGVVTVGISDRHQILATGSRDRTVKLWDLQNGFRRLTFSWETGWVNCLAISADQNTLVAGTDAGHLYQINLLNFQDKPLPKITNAPVQALAFMPGNQRLVVSQGSQIFIYHLPLAQVESTLTHSGEVKALAISPDGQWLASGGRDQTIKLWNLQTQEPLGFLKDHEGEILSLAFSPKGDILVSGGADGRIKLWEVRQ